MYQIEWIHIRLHYFLRMFQYIWIVVGMFEHVWIFPETKNATKSGTYPSNCRPVNSFMSPSSEKKKKTVHFLICVCFWARARPNLAPHLRWHWRWKPCLWFSTRVEESLDKCCASQVSNWWMSVASQITWRHSAAALRIQYQKRLFPHAWCAKPDLTSLCGRGGG